MPKLGDKKEFSWKKFDSLLKLGATEVACKELMGVSIERIILEIKKTHNTTFSKYRLQKMQHTKLGLVQHAIEKATGRNGHKSDSLHIFALKNLCGWTDKQEITTGDGHITLKIDGQDDKL